MSERSRVSHHEDECQHRGEEYQDNIDVSPKLDGRYAARERDYW